MFIFGKNNNHLIKNNYKNTFSLPQKLRLLQKPITKCACGYDFILCLTQDGKIYCYFQSAIYQIKIIQNEKIIDIANQSNLLFFVSQKGFLYHCQFLPQKLLSECLKPKILKLNISFPGLKQKNIKQVKIVSGQVFLKLENNLILNMRQNNWIQTKSFTDPNMILASRNYNIINIVGNKRSIYFLTGQNQVLQGNRKNESWQIKRLESKQKFVQLGCDQNQLFGINEEGAIVSLNELEGKLKCKNVGKMSIRFVDFAVGNENYFGLTEDKQVWVWGKNAYGELGLSDYEPRLNLYPLVSLQRYFVKQIFTGINYTVCLIEEGRYRQSVKSTYRSNIIYQDNLKFQKYVNGISNNIDQKMKLLDFNAQSKQNSLSNFNQTNEHLYPIKYSQEEDQQSDLENVNLIINKKQNNKNKQKKSNLKFILNSSKNKSLSNFKKNINQHTISECKRKDCGCQSKNNSTRSLSKNSKLKLKQIQKKSISKQNFRKDRMNINQQTGSITKISNNKKLNLENSRKNEKKSQLKDTYQTPIKIDNYQNKNLMILKQSYEEKIERLEEKTQKMEIDLRNKTEENKELYQLVKQKNLVIDDITSKIKLLQEAIQEHQRNLTARDNQVQQSFLRQKQYQLHIKNLQAQIQKMMQVLNNNDQNKEIEIYRKEMKRLQMDIKSKIEGEKDYYRERIKSIERKFEEEKNLYELQIKNLMAQVSQFKKKEAELIQRLSSQRNHPQSKITPQLQVPQKLITSQQPASNLNHSLNQNQKLVSSLENSYYYDSPTFHKLQVSYKNNQPSNSYHQNHIIPLNHQYSTAQNQSQLKQKQTIVLHQKKPSNKELQNVNNDIKTKKNSKSYAYFSAYNTPLDENDQTYVETILQKINKNKNSIGKSANKLLNLLQNQI